MESNFKVLAKNSKRSFVRRVANAIIELTKVLYAVTVHRYMAENVVQNKCVDLGETLK